MLEPIKNIDILIRNMKPVRGADYAFCQIDELTYCTLPVIPLAMFNEVEGITVIYPTSEAENLGLTVVWIGTLITLNVNSSLDAVGFLARITNQLASENISVNAFSPVSHDHLFVKPADADRTMEILHKMTQEKL
jgi:hypothetical protein